MGEVMYQVSVITRESDDGDELPVPQRDDVEEALLEGLERRGLAVATVTALRLWV